MTKRYDRVTLSGKKFDAWTAQQAKQVATIFTLLGGTGNVLIAQGSYNKGGVGASAGTHDGGGAIDWFLSKPTATNWTKLQQAARWAQFAAWHRLPSQGPWDHHVHGILVGNDLAAPLAKAQVEDYKHKKNGLKGHAADRTWRPKVIFESTFGLNSYSTATVQKFAKKKGGNVIPRPSVKQIQTALNLKQGSKLKVDGKYGAQTKAAYLKWEAALGSKTADGIPSLKGLTLLGAGRFNVTK